MTVVGPSVSVMPQLMTTALNGVEVALARDGTLVYVSAGAGSGAERTLLWVDRLGHETPLGAPPRTYNFPRIAPDGTRIAVKVFGQNAGIWLWDLPRATLTPVTFRRRST
jgi:hypothetical protein